MTAASRAQAVGHADLIGTWSLPTKKTPDFIFRPDSTVTMAVDVAQGEEAIVNGRWRLAGDTLTLDELRMNLDGQETTVPPYISLVTIKRRGQLTVTTLDENLAASTTRVFERMADSATSGPPH